MNVLVTGAAGLLGTELCLMLRAQGHDVVGVDNGSRYALLGEDGPRAQADNFKLLEDAGVEVMARDLNDLVVLDYLSQITHVVHAAAQVCHSRKKESPGLDVTNNIVVTVDLLDAARRYKLPFLFISSSKVYGENFDDYAAPNGIDETCPLGDQTHLTFFGASKAAADLFAQMYARQYGMTVGVFRPGCFTGRYALAAEAQNWLPWLVHCAKHDRVFRVFGDGTQERDLLHSSDMALACMLWLREPSTDVWNIGGGVRRTTTINAAIREVNRLLGTTTTVEFCSPRAGDIRRLVIDSSKFSDDYDWNPEVSLDDIFFRATSATS